MFPRSFERYVDLIEKLRAIDRMISGLKSVLSLAQRIVARSRVDRWPPVPTRTNDRLVLDTGSISWFICGTQGCHLLSRVEPARPKSISPVPKEDGKGG